jgi:hypothetical protein
MKKLFACGGIMSPAVFLASLGLIVPQAAVIALIVLGGVGALLGGLGGIIFEFILGFIVQSGITPMELLLGL